jgi:hypothetical protein
MPVKRKGIYYIPCFKHSLTFEENNIRLFYFEENIKKGGGVKSGTISKEKKEGKRKITSKNVILKQQGSKGIYRRKGGDYFLEGEGKWFSV